MEEEGWEERALFWKEEARRAIYEEERLKAVIDRLEGELSREREEKAYLKDLVDSLTSKVAGSKVSEN